MPTQQMDVVFTNPFYHNQLGLLGGSEDHDTIYTLPADTVLPSSAIVVEGESEYRKKNPPKRAHSRDGKFMADDPDTPDVNEAYELDAQPDRAPARKTPVEGAPKTPAPTARKRKAAK